MAARTGGPAFPRAFSDASQYFDTDPPEDFYAYLHGAQSGMTLRDWLAGQAITGAIAAGLLDKDDPNVLAASAYRLADAMLAEREE